nr:replication associated protein [Lake Sarah-associated circular virus-13]
MNSKSIIDNNYKSTRWGFTAFESQWDLFKTIASPVAEWGWQEELCPTSNRLHYQGYIRTQSQVRFSAMKDRFPGVHFLIPDNWSAWLNYCKKSATRNGDGNQVHEVAKNRHMTMADALTALVPYRVTEKEIDDYFTQYKRIYDIKDQYWTAVNRYISETKNYESIGLFTNAQMVVGWAKTKKVWIDRQTDIDRAGLEQAEALQGGTEEPPAEPGNS